LFWIEKDTSVLYNRKQAVAEKPRNVMCLRCRRTHYVELMGVDHGGRGNKFPQNLE